MLVNLCKFKCHARPQSIRKTGTRSLSYILRKIVQREIVALPLLHFWQKFGQNLQKIQKVIQVTESALQVQQIAGVLIILKET